MSDQYYDEIRDVYSQLFSHAGKLISSPDGTRMDKSIHFVDKFNPVYGKIKKKDSLYEELNLGEKRTYDFAYEILRHKTPSDPKIVDHTVRTEQIEWLKEELATTIENPDIRPINFLGAKGSGKTTCLNLVIHDFNKEFDANRMLLIRGNAEEYFEIKKKIYANPLPAWGIQEYMKHYAVSLVVYMREKEPFKTIASELMSRKLSKDTSEVNLPRPIRKILHQNGIPRVGNLIDMIAKQCVKLDKSGFPGSEKMLTYQLMCEVLRIEDTGGKPQFHTSWQALWDSLNDYFIEQDIKVFFILDGLDNVWSFGEAEKAAYQSTIDDLAYEFRNYYGKKTKKTRYYYIVACRPESFEKINEASDLIAGGKCPYRYNPNSKIDKTEKILSKKLSRLRVKVRSLQKNKSRFDKESRFYQAITETDYFDNIARLASEVKMHDYDLFAGNTRGILHNFLSFAVFVAFYSKEVNRDLMPPQITEYHIFLRNLFFGGRRFVRTNESTHQFQWRHSVIYPNIFHFDIKGAHSAGVDLLTTKFPILCGMRLLDELSERPRTDEELKNILSGEIGYDKKFVQNTVHLFLQFRLIEPIIPEPGRLIVMDEFRLLKSANVMKYLLYNYIDILSYLAFDSVLPEHISSWIFSGIDLRKINNEYITIILSVGLKFIAFLNAISSFEGGSRSYFPIEGYLERSDYLLSELTNVQGKERTKVFLRSLVNEV